MAASGGRDSSLGEPAKEMPVAMLTASQLDAFTGALRTRLLDREGGLSKRYLRKFLSEIRFNGKKVLVRGKKAALLAAAEQKEMGTARVHTSVPNRLPRLAEHGNQFSASSRYSPNSAGRCCLI